MNGNPDSPLINFYPASWRAIVKDGKVTYQNAFPVTDLVPTTANIVELVRAARARWKIFERRGG